LIAVLEWKWQVRWPAAVPGIRAFEINKRRLEHLVRHPGRFRDSVSRRDWLFLLAGLLLLIPGAAPKRFADASVDVTAANKRQDAQNADRGNQAPTIENSDQAPSTLRAASDNRSATAAGADESKDAPPKDPPRGPLIEIYAINADGTNPRKVAAVPKFPIINSPEISPDGKWIAVDGWNWDQNLRDAHNLIVNLETGRVKDLGVGCMPTWSLDGKWIAYSKYQPEGGVFIREVDGDDVRLIDQGGWGIQWSSDGFKLAFTRDGNIIVYDFIADLAREIFPPDEKPYSYIYWNIKWSPDSKRICFKGRRPDKSVDIALVSATAGGPQLRVVCEGDGDDYNEDFGWHPDGSRVAIPRKAMPDQPGQIFEFNPDKGKPLVLLAGQPADRNNGGLCWSRDGKTLYFVSYK
jgi:Tol biopolymer transport system component